MPDGGSDWGNIAVDTDRGIIFANCNDMPNYNQLIPREEADERGLRSIAEGGSGPIVTAGGLMFIAATTDDLFRAIDIATGEVRSETELPAGGQVTPITYEAGGEQYVVISPRGHHFMETKVGDCVIAYKLGAAN